ncbi:hypothetical protein [Roseovarius aestuariivivens]|uniref:hypothetical protein n=1 Tax=Roseovarius aestuariivivens TaxID=1888910 RepID=UPI00108151C6|nr:hypothetical protein [Roseovarius aestuariivivens]
MIETTYLVTKAPAQEGKHFVHAESCQVRPDQEMVELGVFGDCQTAVAEAAKTYAPLNACALCCPECYIKSDDPEDSLA